MNRYDVQIGLTVFLIIALGIVLGVMGYLWLVTRFT